MNHLVTLGVMQGVYPESIFKFRGLGDRTNEIFENSELWFSSPHKFNDPYDTNTNFVSVASDDRLKHFLEQNGIPNEDIEQSLRHLKTNPESSIDIVKDTMGNTAICCFSKSLDSLVQWSHYSNYHTGISIEFSLLHDPEFFTFPVSVRYSEYLPKYDHLAGDQMHLINNVLGVKHKEWSYEDELRIIKPQNPEGLKKFNPNCIRAVYFGTKCSKEDMDDLKSLIASTGKYGHIKYYKAFLSQGEKYGLDFIPA